MRKLIDVWIDAGLLACQSDNAHECLQSHTPNKRTVRAIRDAEAGKGLTKYKNVADLRKKLGV